jgi:putative membrane protein
MSMAKGSCELCPDRPANRFNPDTIPGMNPKTLAYIAGLLGLSLLVVILARSNLAGMLETLRLAGWPLLWLVPYRVLFFLLYAVGWLILLRQTDPNRHPGLGYLLWVTAVREAIDRLLPVASVGGGIVGVRLLRWKGVSTASAGASVIIEMLLTLTVVYVFTAVGVVLLTSHGDTGFIINERLITVLLLTLPVPLVLVFLLRYGSIFKRLEARLRPLVGMSSLSDEAEALDQKLQSSLRRVKAVFAVGALQLAALLSGSLEIWFALHLFGQSTSLRAAVILESMTQAVRHLAFFIPAGLGVQEASLLVFGNTLGISSEMALAVSMAKRMREVLCGLPPLLWWQWVEIRRLRGLAGSQS